MVALLKLDCDDSCTTLKIQKSEMYILVGWMSQHVNYTYLNKADKNVHIYLNLYCKSTIIKKKENAEEPERA